MCHLRRVKRLRNMYIVFKLGYLKLFQGRVYTRYAPRYPYMVQDYSIVQWH